MKEINATELYMMLNPKMVVNVGAYDCEDAFTFARNGAKVHAFEPMDVPMRLHPNIVIYPYALTNYKGKATFHTADNKCSGSLRAPKNHLKIWPRVAFIEKVEVDCARLDDFAIGEIDLLFVDVNGAEAEFIEGATETLKSTKYLFIEASDKELYEGQKSMDEVIAMLPGWSLVDIYNDYERFCDILLKNEQ